MIIKQKNWKWLVSIVQQLLVNTIYNFVFVDPTTGVHLKYLTVIGTSYKWKNEKHRVTARQQI